MAIRSLNAEQLARGMRRLVFGWKGGPPNLPDFMRLCRTIGGDEFDEESQPLPQLSGPDPWEDREWEMAANRYFLGYLAKQLTEKPDRYGKPASFKVMRMSDEDLRKYKLHHKLLDAGPEFIENVQTLVRAKNSWAEDMKDLAQATGDVDPKLQQEIWVDYFARAELEILKRKKVAA